VAKALQIFTHAGIPALPKAQVRRLEDLASEVASAHFLPGPVHLILTDDAHLRRLNATFRGRDCATDVLSFDLGDEMRPDPDMARGEIYVSLPRTQDQAAERQVPVLEEIARLLTHGLLHLAGYDHDTPENLQFMESETDRFLQEAGLLALSETR